MTSIVLKPIGSEKICRNCHWWHSEYAGFDWRQWEGHENQCRRHSPVTFQPTPSGLYLSARLETVWPKTRAEDFCGEFEVEMVPRDKEKAA